MDEILLKENAYNNLKQKLLNSNFIGAIKIKDGLFIGDELASQDFEFAITNKVTHIINCSGRQIRNYWDHLGIKYLTFNWFDHDSQVILDFKDNNADMIFNFIEEAHEHSESCLVHSVRGQNRAATAIEFLNNRRPDLEIRASFIQQLSRYEKRLEETYKGNQTENWTELSSKPHLENEELIITNTFLNSQITTNSILLDTKTLIKPFVNDSLIENDKEQLQSKVKWIDNGEDNKDKLVTNSELKDLLDKENIEAVVSHRSLNSNMNSILKQVFHIHPKDYNFIVKDGMQHIKQKADEVNKDNTSDECELKQNSFDKIQ